MPFHIRKRLPILPGLLTLNLSESGISWTFRFWRWSWNTRTRRHTIDTPGPGYWTSRTRRQTPR